jgi:hypothetical protein
MAAMTNPRRLNPEAAFTMHPTEYAGPDRVDYTGRDRERNMPGLCDPFVAADSGAAWAFCNDG